MASSHSLSHYYVTLVAILFSFTLIIHASCENKLVDEVCKQTSNYTSCVTSLYSDPRTPDADQYTLAFISVGMAHSNAENTKDYVDKLLEKQSAGDYKQRLERCSQDYKKAVLALATAYNDLNSEDFYELADLAGDATGAANDCQAALKGFQSPAPPLDDRNHDLKGLCEIVTVIGKLYTGGR